MGAQKFAHWESNDAVQRVDPDAASNAQRKQFSVAPTVCT
jgi:hypothetical protein